MTMAQKESDYVVVRTMNMGKLTDSEEKAAFAKLEKVVEFLAGHNKHGTINNIITIGERIQAGRFNCFLSNNVESFFWHADDLEKLPQEVASWHGMYRDSFTNLLSDPYRKLLAALKARYAFEIPATEYPMPVQYLRPTQRETQGASTGAAFYVPGAPQPTKLRRTGGFDPYKTWVSPSSSK
ncbi:MAG: hypothetical protein LVQ95_02475 [Candidatus Micrarchaeales archaeon]|nr:hypothetical protein [Candidatus Micrarchaeales archaeon]